MKDRLFTLRRRAIELFPTSRHNQREWIKSILYLRSRPGGSKWLLDTQIQRLPQSSVQQSSLSASQPDIVSDGTTGLLSKRAWSSLKTGRMSLTN